MPNESPKLVPARVQFGLEPAEICRAELLPETGDVEADRHPVQVARAGAGHRVDVGVGVHPEHHGVLCHQPGLFFRNKVDNKKYLFLDMNASLVIVLSVAFGTQCHTASHALQKPISID